MTDNVLEPVRFAGGLTLQLDYYTKALKEEFVLQQRIKVQLQPPNVYVRDHLQLTGLVRTPERTFLLALKACAEPPPRRVISVDYLNAFKVAVDMTAHRPQELGLVWSNAETPQFLFFKIRGVKVSETTMDTENHMQLVQINFRNDPNSKAKQPLPTLTPPEPKPVNA